MGTMGNIENDVPLLSYPKLVILRFALSYSLNWFYKISHNINILYSKFGFWNFCTNLGKISSEQGHWDLGKVFPRYLTLFIHPSSNQTFVSILLSQIKLSYAVGSYTEERYKKTLCLFRLQYFFPTKRGKQRC